MQEMPRNILLYDMSYDTVSPSNSLSYDISYDSIKQERLRLVTHCLCFVALWYIQNMGL